MSPDQPEGGLRAIVADYLTVRRALGFKLDGAQYLLEGFAAFSSGHGATTVTVANALAFAIAPAGASRRYQALRLSAIRCFARWASTIEPATEVPPARLLPVHPTRAVPHIYTDGEIAALLTAAGMLQPTIRAKSYRTLIALMASTGLRTGEVIGLDTAAIDFAEGTLEVTGKYGKARVLPLHPTVGEGLKGYLRAREQDLPAPDCPALLISTRGQRLNPGTVHQTFARLRRAAGLAGREGHMPRLHDLRHTFAVRTMQDAYRTGADPNTVLPLLTTWLGHSEPRDTYWYISGTDELLAAAAERLTRQGRP